MIVFLCFLLGVRCVFLRGFFLDRYVRLRYAVRFFSTQGRTGASFFCLSVCLTWVSFCDLDKVCD